MVVADLSVPLMSTLPVTVVRAAMSMAVAELLSLMVTSPTKIREDRSTSPNEVLPLMSTLPVTVVEGNHMSMVVADVLPLISTSPPTVVRPPKSMSNRFGLLVMIRLPVRSMIHGMEMTVSPLSPEKWIESGPTSAPIWRTISSPDTPYGRAVKLTDVNVPFSCTVPFVSVGPTPPPSPNAPTTVLPETKNSSWPLNFVSGIVSKSRSDACENR